MFVNIKVKSITCSKYITQPLLKYELLIKRLEFSNLPPTNG